LAILSRLSQFPSPAVGKNNQSINNNPRVANPIIQMYLARWGANNISNGYPTYPSNFDDGHSNGTTGEPAGSNRQWKI